MRRICFSVILLFFVSACGASKLDNSFAFDTTSQESLVVLYETGGASESGIIFIKADLAKKEFVNERQSFLLCPDNCGLITNFGTFKFQEKTATFFAKTIPAGQYAPLAKWWNRYPTHYTACYDAGTYVFDLKPGTINLISLNGKRGSTANAAKELKNLMAHYPNIKGEIAIGKPLAKIKFERGLNIFNRPTCFADLDGRPINILKRFGNQLIEANHEQLQISAN